MIVPPFSWLPPPIPAAPLLPDGAPPVAFNAAVSLRLEMMIVPPKLAKASMPARLVPPTNVFLKPLSLHKSSVTSDLLQSSPAFDKPAALTERFDATSVQSASARIVILVRVPVATY
jgi:hypothetical protein